MLRYDAVFAFPAFATAHLPTAVGPSHPAVAVLLHQLLIAEVAQLDGSGNGLAQEVTLVLGLGGRGASGAPVVVVVIVPRVLAQAGASAGAGVLQRQVRCGSGALPEELGLVSSPSPDAKLIPGASRWGEAIVVLPDSQLGPLLWSHPPLGH